MSSQLSPLSRRASICCQCRHARPDAQQIRHATLIKRPKRPYTFTQLVTLSDGSAYLHRTTSPLPVYKATKDVRNSPLWNPSSRKLLNVEDDEAGKLAGFRSRFGRSWDSKAEAQESKEGASVETEGAKDSLMDMIGTYQTSGDGKGKDAKAAANAKDEKK